MPVTGSEFWVGGAEPRVVSSCKSVGGGNCRKSGREIVDLKSSIANPFTPPPWILDLSPFYLLTF